MVSKFGEFLYGLRKEKGLTQAELADMLGLTNKAVSKWETGEAFPETAQLVPLSTIFSVTVDELLKGERNNNYTVVEEIKHPDEEEKPDLKPMTKAEAVGTALSIVLILIGVLIVVTFNLYDIAKYFAAPIMLFCVAVAVFFLIFIALRRSVRSVEIQEEDLPKGMRCIYMIAGGVFIVISAVATMVALAPYSIKIGIPVFFAILIVGIFLLVFGGISWEAFNKQYTLPSDETQKNPKTKKLEDAICGVIMLFAVGTFLLLGFVFEKWHPGWAVFPIGGIVCGIVSTIMKGVGDAKEKK
jgi:transcriptional regulator with XRE-family HTH domain